MTNSDRKSFVLGTALAALIASAPAFALPGKVEKLSFEAKTNLSAVKVAGTSPDTDFQFEAEGTTVKSARIAIPVEKLETGMSLRDKHMRERIFETADKKLPPIEFTLIAPITYRPDEPVEVKGNLAIRGKTAEFAPKCRFQGVGAGLSARCEGEVDLTRHEIPLPSHLGVKVQPNVKLVFSVRGNG